jgi:hypothetical protein
VGAYHYSRFVRISSARFFSKLHPTRDDFDHHNPLHVSLNSTFSIICILQSIDDDLHTRLPLSAVLLLLLLLLLLLMMMSDDASCLFEKLNED